MPTCPVCVYPTKRGSVRRRDRQSHQGVQVQMRGVKEQRRLSEDEQRFRPAPQRRHDAGEQGQHQQIHAQRQQNVSEARRVSRHIQNSDSG